VRRCGWFIVLVLVVVFSNAGADVTVNAGETYVFEFNDLINSLASASPDYTSYDDFSFSMLFNTDLYDAGVDDFELRLYEDPSDTNPFLTMTQPFQFVPFLTLTSNYVSTTRPGTLWYDRTGKVEFEMIAGRIQIDSINIDLNPGSTSFFSTFDAVPEPATALLLCIGGMSTWVLRRKNRCEP